MEPTRSTEFRRNATDALAEYTSNLFNNIGGDVVVTGNIFDDRYLWFSPFHFVIITVLRKSPVKGRKTVNEKLSFERQKNSTIDRVR